MFGNHPDELGASSACSEAVGISGSPQSTSQKKTTINLTKNPQSTSQKKPQSTSQQIRLLSTFYHIVRDCSQLSWKWIQVKSQNICSILWEEDETHSQIKWISIPSNLAKTVTIAHQEQLQYNSHVRCIFFCFLICNWFPQMQFSLQSSIRLLTLSRLSDGMAGALIWDCDLGLLAKTSFCWEWNLEFGFQTPQKNWYMWCLSQIPNSTLSRRMFLQKISPQMYALFCRILLQQTFTALRSRAIFKVAPQLDKNMHYPQMHCSHMGPHLGKRSPLGTFFSCCVPIFFILGWRTREKSVQPVSWCAKVARINIRTFVENRSYLWF